MFEKFVVDFLDKFFGDYFENLDTSHLNLSLWSGNVTLNDIVIKSTALDSLKLPFHVVAGRVGKLTMNIPWKSILTFPVELGLKDLFVVAIPAPRTAYNAETEEKQALALKMKILEEIETKRHSMELLESGGAVIPGGDTYMEKLMMHVIRNVQIRIESIHIRYEDTVTSPENPFCLGIVLKSLHVETTNASWMSHFIGSSTPTFHKVVALEGLGIYLNPGDMYMVSRRIQSKSKMMETMQSMLETNVTDVLKYMVGPIAMELKIQITPSPESTSPAFVLPKIGIWVIMDELALRIASTQFNSIIHFVDGVSFLAQGRKWRKLRPNVQTYKGNARIWWKFAINCILTEIRRRRQDWNWDKIKTHRALCKTYQGALYRKHIQKAEDVDEIIQSCEHDLDNFNIVLVRKQIELKKQRQERIETHRRQTQGWLGMIGNYIGFGLGGSGTEETLLTLALDANLNDEEKHKLDTAIGYTNQALPSIMNCPKEYVEFHLEFTLRKLNVLMKEVSPGSVPGKFRHSPLLKLYLDNFTNSFYYRPVNQAVKIDSKMGDISALGFPNDKGVYPIILKVKKENECEHFLEVCYETFPLDMVGAQKRIKIIGKALEVVYHWKTMDELARCFTPAPDIQLARIQAEDKIHEFTEDASASFKRLVHSRGELIIEIDFVSPYFIIPEDGDLDLKGDVLVVDLGELRVRTGNLDVLQKIIQPRKAIIPIINNLLCKK